MKKYYITTPIYYVNDVPHIGHAYTSIASDVLARFKKLDGYKVFFLTGTDEHGQKVEIASKNKNVEPIEFVNNVSKNFQSLSDTLNLSNNDFIRTTEKRHIISCQKLWKELEKSGNIYLDKYSGWYSVRDEAFYSENELIEGKAPTGADVEWVEEPSYFFKLSNWQNELLNHYEENENFILPMSRRNEVISFVKGGLKDLSISRTSFNWGVPVPNDEKHIMYVWLDALTNYITATGYSSDDSKHNTFWPADLHVVGKDILRFHAVYWPAFLMAANLPLPKRIFAHGWWTNEGEKISKSVGNVIDPVKLINDYGLDQVRYFLIREVPFGNDGDFSKNNLIQRINSDLANSLGNLFQRVITFSMKNCDGKVPAHNNELNNKDRELIDSITNELNDIKNLIEFQKLDDVLKIIWLKISNSNKYIDEQAPWNLKETNQKRMNVILYCLIESIRQLGILIQPFLPYAASNILDALSVSSDQRLFEHLKNNIHPGVLLKKPDQLFPRVNE